MRHWWRLIGAAGVCIAIAAFACPDAVGQKKSKSNKTPTEPEYPASDDDYAAIKNYKNLIGKILFIDGENKQLNVRVDWQHYEPNPKYKPPTTPRGLAKTESDMWRTLQDLQRQQQKALTARTPQQVAQAMNAYQMDLVRFQQENMQLLMTVNQLGVQAFSNPNNPPFKVVSNPKDYAFDIETLATVRKLFLPVEYDDTGNLKKYTDKEKEELRGTDKSKPGYKATMEEVEKGQEVKVYLTPPKKKAAKADDEETEPQQKGTVNMIVMTKELTPDSSSASTEKKRKK